jgi:hypothetical protein
MSGGLGQGWLTPNSWKKDEVEQKDLFWISITNRVKNGYKIVSPTLTINDVSKRGHRYKHKEPIIWGGGVQASSIKLIYKSLYFILRAWHLF